MKKRVLMFGWEFPPYNSGGLGVACYGLSKGMSKKGVKIIFVLPRKQDNLKCNFVKIVSQNLSEDDSHAFNTPFYPYQTSGNKLEGDRGRNSLIEEVLRYADFGKSLAEKEKFDVIHAHDWLSFGAGIKAKEKSGKPLVVHVHATEFDRGGGSGINSFVYLLEKQGMERADVVIAVSNFTKNIIVKHYGISPEKVKVVHNGVDFHEEEISTSVHKVKEEGKKIVLFVGRLALQKGPDYFIEAAKRVCEVTDDVFFVISGSGEMEHQLIERVARLGISDKVFFTGFLRGEELRNVYRAADLFVMPSVSEPFGITPLESLINGTPILISKQSGVSEVVSHALKVDFWDTDDTANKIISTLNYGSLSSCLSENGKKEAEKISWDDAAEKCINIYEEIL